MEVNNFSGVKYGKSSVGHLELEGFMFRAYISLDFSEKSLNLCIDL